ncbi:MAG: hypothetical protein WD845_02695 [Pirellulales bacterium]
MKSVDVLVVYNEPSLPCDHPDWASEAGVLESVEAVSTALTARGHRVRTRGFGCLEDLVDALPNLETGDVVFNLFEGFGGIGQGEAEVAGTLELGCVGMTGSPAQCLALVRDKARTKWLLAGAGIPTAPFALVSAAGVSDDRELRQLLDGGPVIVKPAHEDASLGIGPENVVSEFSALLQQIESVRLRYGAVLAERFIAGREFNAAVIAVPDPHLLPLAEIEFADDRPAAARVVTYEAKWSTDSADDRATPACCPARVPPDVAVRVGEIALAAFERTGCRDYARIDLRMDEAGDVFVLEVNANPDIGPHAGFRRALAAEGIAFDDFLDRMVRTATARRIYASTPTRAYGGYRSTRR